MGNLMHVLKKDASKADQSVFVDFENARPAEEDLEVHARAQAVLDRSAEILEQLEGYHGAGDFIRNAISNPSDAEAQTAAWAAVTPLVMSLKVFFDYSSQVEHALAVLLEALCCEAPLAMLEKKQSLAKQLAELIHFVFQFDDLKMTNPAIQNDFSYYRRTLSRMKMQDPGSDDGAAVSNEEANRMSLFYASPTPMLKCICDASLRFVASHPHIDPESTTDCLGAMASVCRIMIETPGLAARFHSQNTVLFCQRVMVGCIIVYDHVHALGAFTKKNPWIDMRATIKALKMHTNPQLDSLMNALRYSTKHANDEETPKQIKALLA